MDRFKHLGRMWRRGNLNNFVMREILLSPILSDETFENPGLEVYTLQYYTGTQNGVFITEVSSIQRLLNTLQYYTGTQNGVLITEVSSNQRSLHISDLFVFR